MLIIKQARFSRKTYDDEVMGANTYIGNAPNFMVKSISDENGIKMPSFFGYMLCSLKFLIPVFIIDTLVFFL